MLTDESIKDLIPKKIYDRLNHNCPFCGSEIVNSSNLKQRKCSNPNCLQKVAAKAEIMLKDLGYKGIGEKTCYRILKENKMSSQFDLLDYSKYILKTQTAVVYRELYRIAQTRHKIPLYKVLYYAGIDGIGKETAFELAKGQVNFEKFTYHLIVANKDLLFYAQSLFDIEKLESNNVYYVMMTGDIEEFRPRANYIDRLNRDFGHRCTFKEVGKVKKASVLITDSTSATSKRTFAKTHGIPIYTSKEFYRLMKAKW